MRSLRVLSKATDAKNKICRNKTVVVIDVLRATSVITTALANGANRIYPFATIENAYQFYSLQPPNTSLLCGERKGHIIPGFHLDNSPFSYTPETVKEKNILLNTTNGSLAISRSTGAKNLFAGAFINGSALAEKVNKLDEDLIIVCAGTNGFFSLDDALCAGMIIDKLEKSSAWQKDDLGYLLKDFYNQTGTITEKLSNCQHLHYLKSIGYERDVEYCLKQDILQNVAVLKHDNSSFWLQN